MTEFPDLLDRLYRERFTGEVVLCFAEGQPKAAKFVRTDTVRLMTRPKVVDLPPLMVPLAIVHVKA